MPDHPGLSTEALRKLLAANGVDVVGDLRSTSSAVGGRI